MIVPNKSYTLQSLLTLREVVETIPSSIASIPIMHRSPLEPVLDRSECFVPSRLASGRYCFKPNISNQPVLFRGQSESKDPSLPSLYRNQPPYVIENIKLIEFRQLLETYPLYNLFREGIVFPDKSIWRIENPYGLALSYGFLTGCLSLSSSIDVAAFHAVSRYNPETISYEMVSDGEGIIYIFILNRPFAMSPGLTTVGLQPFPRPGLMYEFSLGLPRDSNFNSINHVVGIRFRHCRDDSEYYFNMFNEGRAFLREDDPLLPKVSSLLKSRELAESAFQQNLADNPNDSEAKNRSLVINSGYILDQTKVAAFSVEELLCYYSSSERIWQELCDKIVFWGKNGAEKKKWLLELPCHKDYRHYFEER